MRRSAESPTEPPVPPASLEDRLRAEALTRGFAAVGIARAEPSDHAGFLRWWLERGMHGDMGWMATESSVARRSDVDTSLPDARSVVVLAEAYPGAHEPESADASRAVIARYARGTDYHRVLTARVREMAEWLEREAHADVSSEARGADREPAAESRPATRVWVDTGPVLEREWAQRAGLGWFGRNTMLIRPGVGSYLLLGVIVTTLELDPDPPFEADHCGSCRACLDACPTGALLGRDENGAPVMDARRCISYLTIENKGPIPVEFREAMGNRVFGCDICQEVCPFPGKFGPRQDVLPAYEAVSWPGDREGDPPLPLLDGPDLVGLTERILAMSGKEYQRVFAESPLARPGRKRMLRNLCVALGNYGATSAEAAEGVRPVLEQAADDSSELVREHAEWGLGQIEAQG